MTRRMLDEIELKLSKSNLERLEAEKEYQEYLGEHAELMLKKGIRLNYRKQLREYEDKKREVKENLEQINQTIDILKEQIEKGVESKGEE